MRRTRENHWVCVTWSSNKASICNTGVSYSPVKCWNSRHRQTKGGCWSGTIFLPTDGRAWSWNVLHTTNIFSVSDIDVSVFEGHQSDTFASSSTLGGIAETYPNFSWSTMTPSQQHDAPIPTPNAPLGTQWNVAEAIPNMDGLLGVDLRHWFSAEADQVEARRHWGRRNPDRQARRWEWPYGTSSHHHRHHNEWFSCLCLNMLLYVSHFNSRLHLSILWRFTNGCSLCRAQK